MSESRKTKTSPIIATILIFSLLFLSSETISINLFPIIDQAVFNKKANILKVYEVNLGEKFPEAELIKISKEVRANFKNKDNLYLVISVKTDPVGKEETNRRIGFHYSNWVGQFLVSSGIPLERVALIEPEEDKSLLEESYLDFRKEQTCQISLIEGSDLLKHFSLMQNEYDKRDKGSGITILSPLMKETDKGFHILKGLVEPLISVMAVTVNNTTKTISVFDGTFETPISLVPGNNVIFISGKGPGNLAAAASLNILYKPPKPTIVIDSPEDGDFVDISRSLTIVVKGKVKSSKNIISAFLIQNGLPRNLKIDKDGTFRQKAVLLSDKDTFKVEVINTEGYSGVSKEHTVTSYGISRQRITVILNWHTYAVDLDLIVKDLYGNWTSFETPDRFRSHRSIPEGNLAVDDKDGFGPEIFIVTENRNNSYDIYIKYYYGKKETMAYLTVILFPDIKPKRIIKTFGPFKLTPSEDDTFITRVKMPEGLFLKEFHHGEVRR